MNGLSLCAGVGALDLGLRLALGAEYRSVCFVEREAYAAAVLVARMADKALDQAPIWDDVTTFDGRHWRGAVDIVSAGFPCQPFSVAGSRRGIEDERWLWPDIARIIRDVRPRYVFLENVPPIVRHGLGYVLGDLAALGFDAEWDLFRASDVGAPHRRERFFLLADSDSERRAARRSASGCDDVANTVSAAIHGTETIRTDRTIRATTTDAGDSVGYADDERREEQCSREPESAALSGSERAGRRFPPGPSDSEGWRDYIESGGPAPATSRAESILRGGPDGLASRLDRLHAIGNGVVPQVVAVAFLELKRRLAPVG